MSKFTTNAFSTAATTYCCFKVEAIIVEVGVQYYIRKAVNSDKNVSTKW